MCSLPSPPTLEPPANITRGGGAKRGVSLLVDLATVCEISCVWLCGLVVLSPVGIPVGRLGGSLPRSGEVR